MKHLDLFSGYGGFTIPAKEFGIETINFSEIDKYASAVLKYRFPSIPNLGDVSEIDTSQLPDFDLLTGGTPCQDLSLAGKRKGLSGERSGLFFQFIRILKEKQPRYFIWENVKGALSSNSGWDFARVQIEMEQAGYSLQWAVLNAKDFGVPQNRERIFVIGTRGGSQREILPIPESSGQALKELTQGVSDAQRVYSSRGVAKSQKALGGGLGAKTGLYAVDITRRSKTGYKPKKDNISSTITATYYKGMGTERPGVGVFPMRWERTEKGKQARRENSANGKDYTPFNAGHRRLVPKDSPNIGAVTSSLNKDSLLGVAIRVQGDFPRKVYASDKIGALASNPTSDNLPRVAVREATKKGFAVATEGDSINFSVPSSRTRRGRVGKGIAQTLDTASNQATLQGMKIRRLTPVECERLMGLEDGWTSKGIIDGKEVEISDTQRYKMCGNGVVVNVIRAIYFNLTEDKQ